MRRFVFFIFNISCLLRHGAQAVGMVFLIFNISYADSWVEKPDIDFYVHPFVETHQAGDRFRGAKIVEVNPLKVKAGGKYHRADVFNEDLVLKKGARVVCKFKDGGVSVVDYNRIPVMVFLLLLFAVGAVGLNFNTGLRAVLALGLSIASIIFLFLPAVEKGYSPVFSGFLTCVFISFITLYLIGAGKKKTLPAFIGTVGGISAVFVFAKLFLAAVNVGGFSEEQIQLLNYLSHNLQTHIQDIPGIFFAGIIIGATGVIMDVAISISSSLVKIKDENPDISRPALFSTGMNIGRDIIASMANSLLFAYIGGALFLLVSRSFFTYSFTQLLNSEWFSVIVVEIFSGTLGIIITVPLTSFVSSLLLSKKIFKVSF